jgi:hypothetical protein
MSFAYFNQNRWVAECDTESCTGAERFWPGGRLRTTKQGVSYGITSSGVLHCGNCEQTSQVVFPEDRTAINRILARRSVPQTRNWNPGETTTDLEAENMTHGV